jgi:hypothetical protein
VDTDGLNPLSLPVDRQALQALLRAALEERDRERQRAEQQARRADDLHVENLRLQLELDRYKKWYYGPRADRLQSSGDLAQMLLNFAEEMDRKPVNPDDRTPPSNSMVDGSGVCAGRLLCHFCSVSHGSEFGQ